MQESKIIPFPETEQITPSDLYTVLYPSLLMFDEIHYICAPVTSPISQEQSKLPLLERKRQNRARALMHIQALGHHYPSKIGRILLPVDVGSRKKVGATNTLEFWEETEYNAFMMMNMLGIPVDYAKAFEEAVLSNSKECAVMNDYQGALNERELQYQVFEQSVINAVRGIDLNPAHVLVFPESPNSFGCRMEVRIAEKLGLLTSFLTYVGPIPVLQTILREG